MKTSLAIILCFCVSAEIGGSSSGIRFQDIGASRGIRGVTICGGEAKTAVIEVNGSGACWLDYNNDGFLDLFVVNGSTLEALRTPGSPSARRSLNYLYRNNGNGTFTELAETAGVAGYAWGTGCAAADYNNDGFTDLFVANVGECFLFRNQADGTFANVAKAAGVAGGFNWHTGAAFGDYDSDGFLDLYVAAYLDPTQMLSEQKKCAWKGLEVYCGPPGMRGAPDVLYRNNGDGTFSNASQRAGVEDRDRLFGFTASFDDFNNDGRLDIFVANDRGRNYLFQNLGQGKFKEVGEIAGAAYPADGRPQANMGVAIGDYDRNGAMDIFVTTFADESFTLYKNTGTGSFVDVSAEARLTMPTLPFLGWGTFFADLDNDGRLDLFIANGHVYPEVDRVPRFKQGFAQRPLLFRQFDAGVFAEIALTSGMAGLKHWSSRGAAYADFDNDGDIDVIYTHLGAAPTLMENVTASPNHWITIKTVGTKSNRNGIGARLKVKYGDEVQFATVRSGESYLSGNDPRIHVGLGASRKVDELEIRWPSGQVDRIPNIPSNQRIIVQEGKGIVQASEPSK